MAIPSPPLRVLPESRSRTAARRKSSNLARLGRPVSRSVSDSWRSESVSVRSVSISRAWATASAAIANEVATI